MHTPIQIMKCLSFLGRPLLTVFVLMGCMIQPALATWSVVRHPNSERIRPGALLLCEGSLSLAETYPAKRYLRPSAKDALDRMSGENIQLAISAALSLSGSRLRQFWRDRPSSKGILDASIPINILRIAIERNCVALELHSDNMAKDLATADPLTFVPLLKPWESALTWLSLRQSGSATGHPAEDISQILSYMVLSEALLSQRTITSEVSRFETEYRKLFGRSRLDCTLSPPSGRSAVAHRPLNDPSSFSLQGDFSSRIVRCGSSIRPAESLEMYSLAKSRIATAFATLTYSSVHKTG